MPTQDSNGKQYADKSGWLWQTVWRPNDCLGNLGCHDVNVRDFSLSYQFMSYEGAIVIATKLPYFVGAFRFGQMLLEIMQP